ncbi:Guanine nucleotide-binding protein subunit gamma 1 [Morella rubra]|uniref:Guanine nucleotide-binding protein subunit gamma 1 n=1 Tax=Morella rubra TaxID=262757 RepID=A0A6A1UVS7_9ROSI|nr:Guanine nucleotide-binding protein subunit gamma 1 [Morella rubra]
MDESVQGDAIDEQQKSQPSSSPGAPPSPEANAKTGLYLTYFGKHRMAAAISNLHNQINIIQEEMELLDTLGKSSSVCDELVSSLESARDPLLPSTMGPVDLSWDRWFRGVHTARNHKRWI